MLVEGPHVERTRPFDRFADPRRLTTLRSMEDLIDPKTRGRLSSMLVAAVCAAVWLLCATQSAGCAADALPPLLPGSGPAAAGTVTSPDEATDSFDHFERAVIPVLEARCGLGCHGVSDEGYGELVEADPLGALYIPLDSQTGRVPADAKLRRTLFDVVRGVHHGEHGAGHGGEVAVSHHPRPASLPADRYANSHRIDYHAEPDYSPLLREPLEPGQGGLAHQGIVVFSDVADPDYIALHDWLAVEIADHAMEAPPESPAEQHFRAEVIDVLNRNSCFVESCHGTMVFNDLKLTAPLPPRAGELGGALRLSHKMLAANREMMIGSVSRLINFSGDLRRSRLLVKNIPIEQGGVHQRGGNRQLFEGYEDPDVELLMHWMELERDDRLAGLRSGDASIDPADVGRLAGIAFLRGPRHAPRRFFDLDTLWRGTALMLLPDGAEAPHTLLSVPDAEIQAFDVRYDGKAIVLSLRRNPEEGFRLYQLELDRDLRARVGSLKPLSSAPARGKDGQLIHHIDPLYIPCPDDVKGEQLDDVAIAFASNEAGEWSHSDTFALLGEADRGDRTTLVDDQRTERAGTLAGRRLSIVDGPMRGVWRTIETHAADGHLVLDRPLPTQPDRRTVYTIEKLAADPRPAFDIWRFVPGEWERTATRTTFTSAQERRPTMRTTGEVMFTTVRNRGYQGDRPVYNGAIFRTMNGGFDYHIQGGNRSRYPLYSDSRELPSGLEIRLLHDPRNLWGGGIAVTADHGFGVNLEPNNPVDNIPFGGAPNEPAGSSSQRFLPTQHGWRPEVGRDAVVHTGLSPGGSFRDPYPLSDGTVLIAHTSAPLDHLDPSADPDWDLYLASFPSGLQSVDGLSSGPVQLDRIEAASTTEYAEFSPRPITVRLKERARTHQKFAPSDVPPRRFDGVLRKAPGSYAEIECYDYFLLQSFLTHFAPHGERDFKQDEIRYVRIVQQTPPSQADLEPALPAGPAPDPFATRVSAGVHARQHIVAEVPVEADGSFYVRVPTEVPLIVQGLNADKMAVHAMNRWFYLQPGEKLTFSIPRSIFSARCAGCHGALTGGRDALLGPPDVSSAASRVAATWEPQLGLRREPHPIARVSVDYRRDVQPLLDRRCVSCHGGEGLPAANLDLRGLPDGPWTRSYQSLHRLEDPASGDHARKRYINEREALASESPLLELLTGRPLSAGSELLTPGVPHPEDDPLTADELLTLTRWIDLGATFIGGEAK